MQSSGHILGLVISILLITACSGKDPVGTATSSSSSSSSSSGKPFKIAFVKTLDGIEVPVANQRAWVYTSDGKSIAKEKLSDANGVVDFGVQTSDVTYAYNRKYEWVDYNSKTKFTEDEFIYFPFQENTGELKIESVSPECTKTTKISVYARIPEDEIAQLFLGGDYITNTQTEFTVTETGAIAVFDVCDAAPTTPKTLYVEAYSISGFYYKHKIANLDLRNPSPIDFSFQERAELAEVHIYSDMPLRANIIQTPYEEVPIEQPQFIKYFDLYFPSENIHSREFQVMAYRSDDARIIYNFHTPPHGREPTIVKIPVITDNATFIARENMFTWAVSASCKEAPNSIYTLLAKTLTDGEFRVSSFKRVTYKLPIARRQMAIPEVPEEFALHPTDIDADTQYTFTLYPSFETMCKGDYRSFINGQVAVQL